ncbi:MAG: dihydroxyacetone kinase subunit L [Mobilitalea sp.]
MDCLYIKRFLKELMDIMALNKDYLIELDSIVGDGDLGLTMESGFTAAYKAIEGKDETDLGKLLYMAGKAMGKEVPSTMGTLMAAGLMNAGKAISGKMKLTNEDCITIFRSYMEGVLNLGKAKVGEKTFLDGIAPAIEAMEQAISEGQDLYTSALKAEQAAKEGVIKTTTMRALHGRAAIRGDASIVLIDPGATVAAYIFSAFVKSLKQE